MTALQSLLDRYTAEIRRRLGGDGGPELGPTRPEANVRRQLEDILSDPVESLVELWSWHDGEVDAGLFWGGSFQPLDRVEEEISEIREFLTEERAIFLASGADWAVPIAEAVPIISAGLAHVLVDSSESPTRGAVFYYAGGQGVEGFEMFPSLHAAVEAALYCLEAGLWQPDRGGRFMSAPSRTKGVTPGDLASPPFAT